MGYTMDEILTLASMIEKEASKADFTKVSAVFHNRLKAGMKLQSDVTIHYITGVRKMSLTGSDLALDSLYNTYQVTGAAAGPDLRAERGRHQRGALPGRDVCGGKLPVFLRDESRKHGAALLPHLAGA